MAPHPSMRSQRQHHRQQKSQRQLTEMGDGVTAKEETTTATAAQQVPLRRSAETETTPRARGAAPPAPVPAVTSERVGSVAGAPPSTATQYTLPGLDKARRSVNDPSGVAPVCVCE